MIRLLMALRAGVRRLAGGSLGASGEKVAERWLRKHGYRVLERNFTPGDDEIDLVALDPDKRTIVIVEVKTRGRSIPANPEASVGRTKQHRLARAAARLAEVPRYRGKPIRFDVIAIMWPENGEPEIRHIPAAFESPF